MATRNKRLKIVDDFDNQCVTFTSPDGVTRSYSLGALPEKMITILAVNRLHNKLMDSYADADKFPDPWVPLTDTWQMLTEGNWSSRGGEGAERIGLFVEAYAAIKKLEISVVRDLVNSIEASDDEARKEALKLARANPQVKAHMARIAEERAKARRQAATEAAKKADAPALGDLI